MRAHGAELLDRHYKQFKQTFIEALSCGTDIFKWSKSNTTEIMNTILLPILITPDSSIIHSTAFIFIAEAYASMYKTCISVLLEKGSSVYLKDLKPDVRSVGTTINKNHCNIGPQY